MWAWNLIRGKPAIRSASVSGIGGGGGSYSNYGGDAGMAETRAAAEQRRARRHRRYRRRRRRAHQGLACSTPGRCAAQRRARRGGRRRFKAATVGTQVPTGKRIYRGLSGGRFTRGSRGRRNYL